MSTTAVAQMLSIFMYNLRFFPYYVSNVLAGLDENGQGAVFSYDPIGHCERTIYRAGGSAGALLQPVLDSQIGLKNQVNPTTEPLSKERAIAIIKDTFISATECDIYTGKIGTAQRLDTIRIHFISSVRVVDYQLSLILFSLQVNGSKERATIIIPIETFKHE